MTGTTTDAERAFDETSRRLHAFARLPVLAIGAATSMLLLATSGRGGWFADEVYFVQAGHHPSWGYADQPPLVPLLARALDSAFHGSLVGLRLPVALLTGLGAVLTALIARELGGDRRAQWLAAAAYPLAPVLLGFGRLLGTYSIDPVLWTLAIWLLVRWIRLDAAGVSRDRLLLAFGVVVAVDVQVKYLVGGFLVLLGVAVLAAGPRRMLTRPLLWAGAAVTVVTMAPGVVWQAEHGWPQLRMTQVLSAGARIVWEPAWFVPAVVIGAGLPGAFLLCVGVWRLVFGPELRPYRCLGLAAVGTTVLFAAAGGAFYYVDGLLPLCLAAGATAVRRRPPARWWRWVPTVPVCAVLAVLVGVSTAATKPGGIDSGLTGGWTQVAAATAEAYRALPEGTRRHTVPMAEMYYQAAALERFGPRYGLPARAYSANRGYWYFGAPPDDATTVVYAGGGETELRGVFRDVRRVGVARGTPTGSAGQNEDVPIWLCSSPRQPWSVSWARLQRVF